MNKLCLTAVLALFASGTAVDPNEPNPQELHGPPPALAAAPAAVQPVAFDPKALYAAFQFIDACDAIARVQPAAFQLRTIALPNPLFVTARALGERTPANFDRVYRALVAPRASVLPEPAQTVGLAEKKG